MNWWRGVALVFVGTLLCVGFVPNAKADEWNKKTIFTFKEPVEVSGTVLPAGKYVFRLFDSDSNRHIVQIFSEDETYLYATVFAIPDYRLDPTDKTVVTFRERPKYSPEAIDEWFYPGDLVGQEFVP
jgi:hypothetical protein